MYHIKDDKRARTTSTLLYRALCDLLKEKPLDAISVTALTQKAGVGRATFYRNFDTIEDILRYAVDQHFIELKAYLQAYYSKQLDYSLQFFVIPFLNYWERDDALIEILYNTRNLWLLYEAFQKLLRESLDAYFATQETQMPHMDYFIAFRTGIAVNILIQWVLNKRKDSPESIVAILRQQLDGAFNYRLFSDQKLDSK